MDFSDHPFAMVKHWSKLILQLVAHTLRAGRASVCDNVISTTINVKQQSPGNTKIKIRIKIKFKLKTLNRSISPGNVILMAYVFKFYHYNETFETRTRLFADKYRFKNARYRLKFEMKMLAYL